MRRLLMLITAWICLAGVPLALPAMAGSGPFTPAIIVNGRAITNYEIAQRKLFLQVLRAPGDTDKLAETQLIQDRLQLGAADRYGLMPTDQQVTSGMAEFASRANLTTEQFVAELAKAGVDAATFRDFVTAGVAWRTVVQQKFGPSVQITQADIDRALSLAAQQGTARILLSEIVLPMTPEYAQQSVELANQLYQTIHGSADFAAAARQYSASSSATKGGRVDWLPLSNLPPEVGQLLVRLAPGQISPPIRLQNAIALFQVRALQDGRSVPASGVSVQYAQYLIPGGHSPAAEAEAQRVRAKVDVCGDLYAIAKGQPEGRLTVTTQTMAQVPSGIGMELAKLDAGESTTTLTRGGDLDFVMLCSRQLAAAEPPSADVVRQNLQNQRLALMADNYLAELQADAIIRRP